REVDARVAAGVAAVVGGQRRDTLRRPVRAGLGGAARLVLDRVADRTGLRVGGVPAVELGAGVAAVVVVAELIHDVLDRVRADTDNVGRLRGRTVWRVGHGRAGRQRDGGGQHGGPHNHLAEHAHIPLLLQTKARVDLNADDDQPPVVT